MPGFSTEEGLSYLANVLYKGSAQEDFTLGLFTNIPGGLTVSSQFTDVIQPVGTGYAEIALVQATFSITALGVVTYPQQQWSSTADWSPGSVYGFYVRNNNATPVLVHVQYRDNGIFQMTNGRTYFVDLSVDSS